MSFDVYRDQYPLWIGSQAEQPNSDLEVIDKFTGEVVTRVALADEATIDRAIAAATAAAPAMAALPAYARQQALEHCVERFRERFDELLTKLNLKRPRGGIAKGTKDAFAVAAAS